MLDYSSVQGGQPLSKTMRHDPSGSRRQIELNVPWRSRFGPKRKTGARKIRGGDWGGVTSLRDLT